MEELLAFAMLQSVTDTLPETITNATEDFLAGQKSVGIVAGDNSRWLTAELPLSFVLWNDWTTRQEQVVDSYIVDIRAESTWSVTQFNSLRRTSWTRFIIITAEEDQTKLSKSILKYGLCHVLIITETASEVKLHRATGKCAGPGQEMAAGDKCIMNASFMDLPPMNLPINDTAIRGFEALQIQTTADYLGFEVNLTNRHENLWADLLNDAAEGKSLASFGAVYGFHYRWLRVDLIPSCSTVTMAFAAPLHAGPSKPTWFIILVSELDPEVWLCTFVIYLVLAVLAIMFLNKEDCENALFIPFHIFALILGIGQNFILHRGFTTTIIFFGFMITIYYQAVMSSKLTAPAKPAEITNWEEILATNWSIKGNLPMQTMLRSLAQAYPNDSIKQEIYRRYTPEPKPLEEMLHMVVEQRNVLYARHTPNIIYLSQKDPILAGKLHIVEEPVITFFPNTMVPKHSCLAEKIQHTYFRLCSSGLPFKWYKDLNTIKSGDEDNGPVRLKISHIKGFLFLLIFGWIVSATTFVFEVNLGYIRRKWAYYQSTFLAKKQPKTHAKLIYVKPRAFY